MTGGRAVAWAVGWQRRIARRLGAVGRAAGAQQRGRDTDADAGGVYGKEDGRTDGQGNEPTKTDRQAG